MAESVFLSFCLVHVILNEVTESIKGKVRKLDASLHLMTFGMTKRHVVAECHYSLRN
jgi:hypothetical protein